mmetsp:Transcript_5337/g.8106  ORF Transcript_5337/g.8106 Transcript_5337/m.8106 type:complete len:236 (+) Transcript_5337:780-1487(+)
MHTSLELLCLADKIPFPKKILSRSLTQLPSFHRYITLQLQLPHSLAYWVYRSSHYWQPLEMAKVDDAQRSFVGKGFHQAAPTNSQLEKFQICQQSQGLRDSQMLWLEDSTQCHGMAALVAYSQTRPFESILHPYTSSDRTAQNPTYVNADLLMDSRFLDNTSHFLVDFDVRHLLQNSSWHHRENVDDDSTTHHWIDVVIHPLFFLLYGPWVLFRQWSTKATVQSAEKKDSLDFVS